MYLTVFSLSLHAQGEFGCTGIINITLNENCQALVTPSMVLTGDLSGLDTLNLVVAVEDDDPSNGGIIDGCGEFTVTISRSPGDVNVPDPDYLPCWGTVRAEDKTAPSVAEQIAPIDLLCVDLASNRVDELPETVSRCFEVFAANGEVVPGSMAPMLRAALRANAGSGEVVIPTFTDGCANRLEVCVNDEVVFDEESPTCEDVVLTRNFTASEITECISGDGVPNEAATSAYTVTFLRPGLDDLTGENIEDAVVYNRCGETLGTVAEVREDYPNPRPDDFPFLRVGERTVSLTEGASVCNLSVTYSDGDPVITCDYVYKFVRTYTVVDWCAPDSIARFTQIVKVGDAEPPQFSGPVQDRDFDGEIDGDLVYQTNAGVACGAYILLDAPGVMATDDCSAVSSVTATIFPNGNFDVAVFGVYDVDFENGQPEISSVIPVGTHLLRYTYQDDCGNIGFSDYPFTVVDGVAPLAVCEDALNVSLNTAADATELFGGGQAVITAEQVDAGSNDDCSDVSLNIARLDASNQPLTDFSPELLFTCDDIGTVTVGLQATDAAGNVNQCWLEVLIEDKHAPRCYPPADRTITCLEYNTNLPADITEASPEMLAGMFGEATATDNCSVAVTSSVSGGINNCGIGSIQRNFQSIDGQGFVDNDNCTQQIDVTGVFDYRITFPRDTIGRCRREPDFAVLRAEEFGCDLITTNIFVDTLLAVDAPEACFTFRVLYEVINFCEYNTLGNAYRVPREGRGIRDPATELLYLNVVPNSIGDRGDDIAFVTTAEDRDYNPGEDRLLDDGNDNDGTDDNNDNDSEESQSGNGVGFSYGRDNSRGFFSYVQYIDVYDDTPPIISVNPPDECFVGVDPDCTVDVPITFSTFDFCRRPSVIIELDEYYVEETGFDPEREVEGDLIGERGQYIVILEDIPTGEHAIRILASDGCGNTAATIVPFCVDGVQYPTPICIQRLTVTLFPDGQGGGQGSVWANDFIASDVEDCYGNIITDYAIYREDEIMGDSTFIPANEDIGTMFTCTDFGEAVPVRVYSIAADSTFGYCSVTVEVQAFNDICFEDAGAITGLVATSNDLPIAAVEVNLEGGQGLSLSTVTGVDGLYQFNGLPRGLDYTIQPAHPINVDLSTVTVSDVVLIGNVILGRDALDTPYDYLAADVDQDQFLTVGDMVAIQRVILGLEDIFETGSSWGFVPSDVVIEDPYSDLFPEVYNINNLTANALNADFVGFAYGDVNSLR